MYIPNREITYPKGCLQSMFFQCAQAYSKSLRKSADTFSCITNLFLTSGPVATNRFKAKTWSEMLGKWGIWNGKFWKAETGAAATAGKIKLTYFRVYIVFKCMPNFIFTWPLIVNGLSYWEGILVLHYHIALVFLCYVMFNQ